MEQKFSYGGMQKLQTFAFKVLQECSSWASRNDSKQMFFQIPNRNMFAQKFLKTERFLTVLREHIIFSVKWVEVRKMSEVFGRNCIAKGVLFFACFCWLWDFLLENLKIKKNNWWCPLKRVDQYRNVAFPKQYFQKKNSKYEVLRHLYFGPKYVFGECFRAFQPVFFFCLLIFRCRPTMVANIHNQLHYARSMIICS